MTTQNKKSLEEIFHEINQKNSSNEEKFNKCFHKNFKPKKLVLVECPFTGTLEEMEVDDDSGE